MNNLPYELVLEILSYLPFKALRTRAKFVSKFWNKVSAQLCEARLQSCKNVLESLQNYPMELLANPQSKLDLSILSELARTKDDKIPFRAWCLGNFEYPGDSNVITGIELRLDSLDVPSGTLVFKPTGMLSFGIWVNHVGFFPITAPYESKQFSFPHKVDPLLRFWFHVDSKAAPGADFVLNQFNHTERLSKARGISRKLGVHSNVLENSMGEHGKIEYEITSEGGDMARREQGEEHPMIRDMVANDDVPTENFIFQHLEMQEKKTIGELLHIYISPEAILSVPI